MTVLLPARVAIAFASRSAIPAPRFLDIELRLAALRVLECSIHDQDDGKPGHREVSEKQSQGGADLAAPAPTQIGAGADAVFGPAKSAARASLDRRFASRFRIALAALARVHSLGRKLAQFP
jgi:hypothetical protein